MELLTANEVACFTEVVGGTFFLDEEFTLGLFKWLTETTGAALEY